MAGHSITRKLIDEHLVDGTPAPDAPITLRVDQLLLQDTNGPTSFLQFEALGAPPLQVPKVVAYIDHNILQVDLRNSDDHRYLETAAARHGAIVSRAGNGICHQVHLETFSVPGECLVGTDSHTVVCGAVGMLALGAGSLQVAVAMSSGVYRLAMPKIARVWLTGSLRPWVTAKDAVLELLRRMSVRGGGGKIFEFAGPGVAGLTVPQRATITNMGAELGLTTAVFPSDEITREYFRHLEREGDWRPMEADSDASYDELLELDLSEIDVLVAAPSSPDRVFPVGDLAGTELHQVIVGSCTNGSWEDMATVEALLRGRQVHPSLSVVLFPGSRRVLEALAREGLLSSLLATGLQIAASGCGACPGLSHVPASGTRSLRTFNRNFPGRSGHREDQVYLCSPVVAAASALTGVITDPRSLGEAPPDVQAPTSFRAPVGGLSPVTTTAERPRLEVIKGPNIKAIPLGPKPDAKLSTQVLLKVGDNISTDHISPVGVQSLLLRTNIPAIAEHSFKYLDPTFVERAKEAGHGIIVAGAHYGQGSSRETAASGLMVLGIRAILAKSFARIHRANLINWGIVPLCFELPDDYDRIEAGDTVSLPELRVRLVEGQDIVVHHPRTGTDILVKCHLGSYERSIVLAGGVLPHAKSSAAPVIEAS